MRCPRCQAENPESARFCEECGARLALACPHCGAEVAPAKRFCRSCGAQLAPATDRIPPPAAYTPKHLAERILTSKAALEGERKRVTVLFADLKGSMELLADRDPEEARQLLDPVLERMMDAVHRYEGTVNQVMGDGIMALFGAPLAHEDHAVRACYAALDMQAAMRRYNEEVRRAHGVEVQIRVGLNSGEVVVRAIGGDLHMDYTALGPTTHLAARMEQLATPGTVRLTANTLRLAEGYVEVRPLGPVPVKGLEQPIDVYEMIGAGPRRSRFHAAAARGLTRFVGRESELEALRQALARTAAGHGQVVAIVGEPGVGKSRLVWEVTHSHRVHGWLVLQASSVSYGKAASYLPIVDLLKGYFGIEDRDGPRTVREKLTGKLLTLDRALEGHLPALLSLLDVPTDDPQWSTLDPPQRRRRTLDAVKRLLLQESQVQPLLVVVEDLHWIDSETQALLDGLVESLPVARLLLLVNYRPEYQHLWSGRTYYTQLRLDPLPPETAVDLLNALLGPHASLAPLKRALIARTGGNPFFLEECVRTLVETRALAGERGAYQVARPLPAIQVPATVQAVIAARIDRLSAEDKALLQTASVIGKDVPLGLLQAIAGLGENELHAAVGRLRATEFLYEAGIVPDIQYTFKHALTHEVTYGSLLQDQRRALHVRIVETIERIYAGRLAEHVDQLAHHAFLGKDWAKAVTYLQQAGAKALARSVHREAVSCFEDALTALTHLPETRETVEQAIDLRFDLRNALLPLAEWGRIGGYLRDAEALARTSNDQRRLGSVLGYMSGLHLNTGGRASDVRAFAQQVEAIGASLGDFPLQVAGRYYHVWLGALSGDHRGTERLCRTLMDSLRADLSREHFGLVAYPAVVSRAFLARALAELGVFDEGRDNGQEAVRLAEALDHPFSLTWACLNLGHLEGLRGEFIRATVPLDRAVALSREWPYLMPIAMAALGHVYAGSGRVGEGVSWLEQARAAYASAGIGYLQSMSTVQLGEAYLLAGRVEEAQACGARAVTLARERGERGHEAWAHHLLGESASHRDCADVAAAEGHHATSAALASELGMRPLVARGRLSLGKLHGRAGDRRAATEHLTTARSMFHEMGMQFWFDRAQAEVQALEIAVSPASGESHSRA